MSYVHQVHRAAWSKTFRAMAPKFDDLAGAVAAEAETLDVTAAVCDGCGSTHYNNFPQKQMHERVSGAAERLREIAATLRRRANEDAFVGERPFPGLLE